MTNQETKDSEEYDCVFKIVLVGDQRVGKSSILARMSGIEFNSDYKETEGIEFARRITDMPSEEGHRILAQIWDRQGDSKKYESIYMDAYYRGALAVVLVYNIADRESFENVASCWLEELDKFNKGRGVVYCLLIGNKTDLEHNRSVSTEEAETFAKNNHLSFIETSALDSNNIEKAFQDVINGIYRDHFKKSTKQK